MKIPKNIRKILKNYDIEFVDDKYILITDFAEKIIQSQNPKKYIYNINTTYKHTHDNKIYINYEHFVERVNNVKKQNDICKELIQEFSKIENNNVEIENKNITQDMKLIIKDKR